MFDNNMIMFAAMGMGALSFGVIRSEERRVGKECRARGWGRE